MTVALPDTAAALLARLDERTGGMLETLKRIESTNNDRFTLHEKEMDAMRLRLAELEAWKNRIDGMGLTDQAEQIKNLQSWKDRILGLGFVLGPLMTFGSAWLVKHIA